MSQEEIYNTYLKHFDVKSVLMCKDSSCMMVGVSALTADNKLVDVINFQERFCNNDSNRLPFRILELHDSPEHLIEKMFYIMTVFHSIYYERVM